MGYTSVINHCSLEHGLDRRLVIGIAAGVFVRIVDYIVRYVVVYVVCT